MNNKLEKVVVVVCCCQMMKCFWNSATCVLQNSGMIVWFSIYLTATFCWVILRDEMIFNFWIFMNQWTVTGGNKFSCDFVKSLLLLFLETLKNPHNCLISIQLWVIKTAFGEFILNVNKSHWLLYLWFFSLKPPTTLHINNKMNSENIVLLKKRKNKKAEIAIKIIENINYSRLRFHLLWTGTSTTRNQHGVAMTMIVDAKKRSSRNMSQIH